jgi:hypothetical protein
MRIIDNIKEWLNGIVEAWREYYDEIQILRDQIDYLDRIHQADENEISLLNAQIELLKTPKPKSTVEFLSYRFSTSSNLVFANVSATFFQDGIKYKFEGHKGDLSSAMDQLFEQMAEKITIHD